MKSRYAGKCAKTGQAYSAGTEIVKGSKGWEIAGNAKVVETLKLRTPEGETRTCAWGDRDYFCSCQKSAYEDGDRSNPLRREADALVCPICARRLEILSETEKAEAAKVEYARDILPHLHIANAGYQMLELSHRVPAEQWEKVKQFFTYWSADDLDDMDCFDMPGGYYLRPGTVPAGTILNSAASADMGTIEAVDAWAQAQRPRPQGHA